MARPTKPKDLKPKTEGEAVPPVAGMPVTTNGSAPDIKFILLLVIMVISSILGSAGSVYLMTSMLITPEIHKISQAGGGEAHGEGEAAAEGGAEGETPANAVGMNLELDEFMVNLKPDASLGGNQYLRAKMALSIKAPDEQNCYKEEKKASLKPTATIAMVRTLNGGHLAGAAAPIGQLQPTSQPERQLHTVDRELLANEGESGPPPCETHFKESMGKYVPSIRDIINASLMKRTASQLASQEGQETLKDEIKEQISQIMAPDYEVLRVNFQDFIIQR
jgi:flagellar basal body-associated protein FliL